MKMDVPAKKQWIDATLFLGYDVFHKCVSALSVPRKSNKTCVKYGTKLEKWEIVCYRNLR